MVIRVRVSKLFREAVSITIPVTQTDSNQIGAIRKIRNGKTLAEEFHRQSVDYASETNARSTTPTAPRLPGQPFARETSLPAAYIAPKADETGLGRFQISNQPDKLPLAGTKCLTGGPP